MTAADHSQKNYAIAGGGAGSLPFMSRIPAYWQPALLSLALSWLAIAGLFIGDIADMVSIWWNVSTYNHILLIVPILGWLVWQYVPQLAQITPRFSYFGALWLLGGAMLWIVGEAAGIALFRHIAVVVMLQGSAIAFCGLTVTRILLFPLFYAFFLVPVGEEIVPWLQTVTADISMFLLGLAGIPAFREGVFISTPTGYFEVAEACSGVKFLIAMIAYGVLVAHVCFRSWLRRIVFIAACIAFPILANGVRAWGTIFIAHHYSLDFATGFDHVFYGWFFFALVLIVVMGSAWPFFDRAIEDIGQISDAGGNPSANNEQAYSLMPRVMVGVCIALPLIWSLATANAVASLPANIAAPSVTSWEKTANDFAAPWQPVQKGAAFNIMQSYGNGDAANVTLYAALYERQDDGAELIGYGQGAFDPESDWAWAANGRSVDDVPAIRITAPGPVHREAVTLYIYGDIVSASTTQIKIAMLQDKLVGRHQPAGVLILSAEDSEVISAGDAMQRFADQSGGLEKLLRQIASGQ